MTPVIFPQTHLFARTRPGNPADWSRRFRFSRRGWGHRGAAAPGFYVFLVNASDSVVPGTGANFGLSYCRTASWLRDRDIGPRCCCFVRKVLPAKKNGFLSWKPALAVREPVLVRNGFDARSSSSLSFLGRRFRAVPLHLFGLPCPITRLSQYISVMTWKTLDSAVRNMICNLQLNRGHYNWLAYCLTRCQLVVKLLVLILQYNEVNNRIHIC